MFGKTVASSAVETNSVTDLRRKTRRVPAKGKGLRFKRVYTTPGVDPYDMIEWDKRASMITNPDGSVVFKMEDVEIPAAWSQLATDIVVCKYFRKAGVHGDAERGETSVRQVVYRIAHTIREAGERLGGYFAHAEDADAFEAELSLHAGPPDRRVQLAGVVQLRPLPARTASTGSGGNCAWDPTTERGRRDRRTPTSARSARPASSSRSTTT